MALSVPPHSVGEGAVVGVAAAVGDSRTPGVVHFVQGERVAVSIGRLG